jgi:hypothetical protein
MGSQTYHEIEITAEELVRALAMLTPGEAVLLAKIPAGALDAKAELRGDGGVRLSYWTTEGEGPSVTVGVTRPRELL